MSRINTNVTSLLAQRTLRQQSNTLNTSLQRLSTGLRINRGADDPAGLIASENLRSEKTSITTAIGNAERADQVINIALLRERVKLPMQFVFSDQRQNLLN